MGSLILPSTGPVYADACVGLTRSWNRITGWVEPRLIGARPNAPAMAIDRWASRSNASFDPPSELLRFRRVRCSLPPARVKSTIRRRPGVLVEPLELGNRRQPRGLFNNRQLFPVRYAIVSRAVEFSASLALSNTAPLLEEERNLGALALVANRQHPFHRHRSGTGPALTADDHPVNALEVYLTQVFEERLDGQESDSGRGLLQMLDPNQTVSAVFDAHTPPDVSEASSKLQPFPSMSRSREDRLVRTW